MMDIIVALLLLLVGAVVVFDSYRLGSNWGSDGPQSGYFPFRVGLLICIASLVTLVQAVRARNLSYVMFVSLARLKLVLTVLIPALVLRASACSTSGSTWRPPSTSRCSWSGWASIRG